VNYLNPEKVVDTDDMTPLFQERFWELWDDVYGLHDYTIERLQSMSPHGLPRYLPLFQHQYLRLSKPFAGSMVALPLFSILKKRRDGSYSARFSTASALRKAFKLRKDTRILLVGVDDDEPLEAFWSNHRIYNIASALSRLNLLGVTVPNFSFFTCVPRFQILRNRKRILLSAERMSKAGVPVSIHINANTHGDWKFWMDFLREHAECSVVTMEFQTGARARQEIGREAFDELVLLQDRVGRPLHPILVGAARFFREATEKFESFTVVDSQPFLRALSRQTLALSPSGQYKWVETPTQIGAHLDGLIDANLRHYENKLLAGSSEDEPGEPLPNPNEMFFDGMMPTPYFTAQPVAR
jgi:hypothetical protein